MSVHIETLSSAVYFYAPGDSYDKASPVQAIGVLLRKDHGEVEVMATHGELSVANLRELVVKLRGCGYTLMHVKRAKGHKVPLGQLVRRDERFDYYAVDL